MRICPRCGSSESTKAGHGKRKLGISQICLCHSCGLHFTLNRIEPFREPKRYSSEIKGEIAQLYLQGYKPSKIRKILSEKYDVKPSTTLIQTVVRSCGLPYLTSYVERERIDGNCPVCGDRRIIRYGYGRRGKQRYLCNVCGTQFTANHVCGIPKFSEKIKQFAVSQYTANLECGFADVATLVRKEFNIVISPLTIRFWVLKAGLLVHPNRGWKKRRSKYGSLGQPLKWLKSRREAQLKLWKDPEYVEHMKKVHQKPRYHQEIIDYCLNLRSQDLSARKVALNASVKFSSRISHSSIYSWEKRGLGTQV